MWIEDYQWHYDYVRLAWDTGFSFEKCKSPNLDKNKICVVDIERIVKERDVASVDRYIPTIVQYILEDDQAKVLDGNFVKMFRISQMAVEFLLFCKKYLDNTVVLLKKELAKSREEVKELKMFNEELQGHVAALTRQQLVTFKCSVCSKVFSSEDFLNSHIKRRHDSESPSSQTDKLNLEIKELKERLNNTEKLLKEKEVQEPHLQCSNNDNAKMFEVIERFKEKVDNELKDLQQQKTLYEETYDKLFERVINKDRAEPKIIKIENGTQTDKVLKQENVQNRNVVEVCEGQEPLGNKRSDKREDLEVKISATLVNIENQMQDFWTKLNAIEVAKNSVPQLPVVNRSQEDIKMVPKVKPRSKLSQSTQVRGGDNENAEKLKRALDELQLKPSLKDEENKLYGTAKFHSWSTQIGHKTKEIFTDLDSQTVSESDSSDSEQLKEKVVVEKPLAPTVSLKQLSSNKEILEVFSAEIKNLVSNRLQDLGISENWHGLPEKSFNKAIDIIAHQAGLLKKAHSNFDSIKKKSSITSTNDAKVNLKSQRIQEILRHKI